MMLLFVFVSLVTLSTCQLLSNNEIRNYRERVRTMFYEAFNSYQDHARDFDELQPISCQGVNTWGHNRLSLIDALDTLAVMGNYSEFNRVARILVDNLNFNQNINVSVFETNIRVVGGLLSAHLLSYKTGFEVGPHWPCSGPLLTLAVDVARRLLPAFDTNTGMPYGTVNLMYGVPVDETPITCTAGVGTFLVEFSTLSRLTGDPIFEEVALEAVFALHSTRSKIGLLGNHINTTDGRWTAVDSSIGAGVDSYFEYLVKGAMLMQMPYLMDLFHGYYEAINKYMKRDDWFMVVNMNSGFVTMPIYQSLESFWPGLLTLVGDINQAQKSIYNYHQVWKQFGFIPEFYDIAKYSVKRDGYPLRPEFVESVFYLYKATRDPHLLKIGADVIESINFSCKTGCGYATIKNVKEHIIEDRMESFFLAETLKYLYLLFDHNNFIYNSGSKGTVIETEKGQCIIDAGGYIFNTEAHPIDSAAVYCCSANKWVEDKSMEHFVGKLNLFNYFGLNHLETATLPSLNYAFLDDNPDEDEQDDGSNSNLNVIPTDIHDINHGYDSVTEHIQLDNSATSIEISPSESITNIPLTSTPQLHIENVEGSEISQSADVYEDDDHSANGISLEDNSKYETTYLSVDSLTVEYSVLNDMIATPTAPHESSLHFTTLITNSSVLINSDSNKSRDSLDSALNSEDQCDFDSSYNDSKQLEFAVLSCPAQSFSMKLSLYGQVSRNSD